METVPVIDTSESITMLQAGFVPIPVYFEGTLVHEGADYTVTAVIGKDAMLPADVSMRVAEVLPGTELYEFYREMMAETLEEDEEMGEFARLFDIAFIAVIDGEETEFEPAADIDVQITFLEAIAVTEEIDVQAVHFDENTPEVMDVSTDSLAAAADDDEAIDTLSFTSDSFSIYGFFQKVKKVIKVITASGETFAIDVSFTSDSGIPDDAELTAAEITPDDPRYYIYKTQAARALNAEDVGTAHFFDIGIAYEGEKIEPNGTVTVNISLDEMPDDPDTVAVVHFGDEGTEVIESVEVSENDIQFQAESFSVYGVITDPGEQGFDLVGQAAIFSNTYGGRTYYVTALRTYDQNIRRLQETTTQSDAALWFFETTGTRGEYYIFTVENGTKRYLNFRNGNGQSAEVVIGDTPQAFSVEQQRDNTYKIKGTLGETIYHLNRWGNGNPGGFAAYRQDNGDNIGEHIAFTFRNTTPPGNNKYVVIVKQGNEYYTVQADGTLIPCIYHADTNMVEMDSPVMWTYSEANGNSHNLKMTEEALRFDGNQLPIEFSYRYINPNADSGITVEEVQGSGNNKTAVSQAAASALQYDNTNHTIHGNGNNNYIGVKEELGKLKISGNNPASSAAEVFLAIPMLPTSPYGVTNAVNHIDISVTGHVNLNMAFAYGTYYKADGTAIVVDKDNPYTCTIDREKIAIKQEDMVYSEITAYKMNEDGSTTPMDNMFYVTGYSNNGKNDGPSDSDQVRIEGFFKVSYTDVPGQNGNYDSQQARLRTPVYYTVTVPKEVTVPLRHNGELVYAENPNENLNAKPIEATTTVLLSASFNYWDFQNNKCPACLNGLGGTWYWGDIPDGIDNDKYHSGSGMDFVLGDTGNNGSVAVEIIKYVVDKQGNPIEVASDPKYSFDIYYSKNKSANYVADYYGVQDPSVLNGLDLESYTKLHTKNIMVGANGSGTLYDYDVGKIVSNNTYALIYIKEDQESIPQTIMDKNGDIWEYTGNTKIVTEYVKRPDAHPDHEISGYTAIPDVLGTFTMTNRQNKLSAFLEFYVYNEYERKTDITVKKTWTDGNDNHANDSVTVRLIRYADTSAPPTPPDPVLTDGKLDLTHEVVGYNGNLPAGFKYYATKDGVTRQLVLGENTLPAGTYTLSVDSSNVTHPDHFQHRRTSISPTRVTITAGSTSYATVNTTYREKNNNNETKVTIRVHTSNASNPYYGVWIGNVHNPDHSVQYNWTLGTITANTEQVSEVTVPRQDTNGNPIQYSFDISPYNYTRKRVVVHNGSLSNNDNTISFRNVNGDVTVDIYLDANSGKRIFNSGMLIASGGVAVLGGNRSNSGLPEGYAVDSDFQTLTMVLNSGNSWENVFRHLDIFDDYGREYYYGIEEISIPGYITTINPSGPISARTENIAFTVTNDPVLPTLGDISLKKTVAGEGCDPNREFVFTITIVDENGDAVASFTGEHGDVTFTNGTATVTLKGSDTEPKWIRNLPSGTRFTIQETPVEGYQQGVVTITPEGRASVDGDGVISGTIIGGEQDGLNSAVTIQVQNIHVPTVNISVTKNWAEGTTDYQKAKGIRFELYRTAGEGGEKTAVPAEEAGENPAVLVGNTDWTNSYTWEKLPRYVDSMADPLVEYIYSVEETAAYFGELEEGQVPDDAAWSSAAPDDIYTIEYSDITAGVITVTNTPKTINIPVEKKWTGIEADTLDWTITVKLQSDHEVTVDPDTMTISKATAESERTFRNLPKYYNGQEIVYTVEETGYLVKRGDEVLYSKDGTTTVGEKEVTTYYSYLMDESRENQKALITNSIATATFTVYKEWKDIVNKNDMPAVHFTLYCYRTSEGNNSARVYVDENNIRYENLELSPATQWKWEKELPDYYPGDEETPGNKLCYYIIETKENGKVAFDKTTIPEELRNSRFIEEDSYVSSQGRHTDPNSEQVQDPYNAYVEGGTGSITVTNRAPGGYMQMDIKKKFLMHQDGSLYTVTGFDVLKQNRVIEVQIYRRAVEDIAITIQQFHPNVPIVQKDGWRPYGDRIRVGYDSAGNPVKDPGNNTFTVDYAGDWHWTINQGEHKGGLPKYGFIYNNNTNQYESVRYQYVLVETGMYKDLSGTQLDDGFDWYAILPAVWEANGQIIMFDQEIAQDQDRLMNAQGTDLTITKAWKGKPQPGTKVYIKVYRLADMNYNPGSAEDYTAKINKPIANWSGGAGLPIPNDGNVGDQYLDTTTAGGPYIVLSEETNWTVTINRTLAAGKNGAYRYWIQEVGYSYQNGEFIQNVSQFNPEYSVISGWSQGVFNNNPTGIKAIVLERKGQNNLGVTNTVTETAEDFSKTWQTHLGEAVDWPTDKSLTVVLSRYSGEGDARQKDTSFEYTITVTPDGENFSCSVTPQTDAITVEKVSMTEGKKYTFRISGLPARDGETEWDYVVEETQEPDGYTFMAGEGENEFINKAEFTQRHATKVWDDEGNRYDTRPGSITFRLIAKVNNTALNDAEMASEGITTDEQPAEQTLTRPEDETADWGTVNWTNLPKITKAGQTIEYSIEELPVPGYTSEEATLNEDNLTWTVTNTLNKTDIRIIKRKHKEEGDESPDEFLTGAEFRLDRKNGGSAFVPVGDAAAVNNVGELSFTGLPDGEYRIVETEAPAGYMPLASPITFTIANGKVNEESIVASSLVTYTAATESLPATFTVDNRPGVALPSTGGEGTAPYILTGIALMAFAGILLMDRKRKAHK
ncbi:Cna B-type domain-containing protein [Clostridiales bacterium]|nr:Cna B-type domain-containing protein [Clostridiales bacterium]